MKIKIEVELDTENHKDREQVEQVLYHVEQIKEILEKLDINLNNNRRRNKQWNFYLSY